MTPTPFVSVYTGNGAHVGCSNGMTDIALELGFRIFANQAPKRFGKKRDKGVISLLSDGYEMLYYYDGIVNTEDTVVFGDASNFVSSGATMRLMEEFYCESYLLAIGKVRSEETERQFLRSFMRCAIVSDALSPKRSKKEEVVFLSDAVDAVNGELLRIYGDVCPPIRFDILPPLSSALGISASPETATAFLSVLYGIMSQGQNPPEISATAERFGDSAVISVKAKDVGLAITQNNTAMSRLKHRNGEEDNNVHIFCRLCGALGFVPSFGYDGEYLTVRTEYKLIKQLASIKAAEKLSPERIRIIADFLL